MQAMDERQVWEEISTAPYNRDLELAVVEADHVHPLIFACRRTASGWVKAASRERVTVSPTHWRPWHREGRHSLADPTSGYAMTGRVPRGWIAPDP
jgi:hypothetical protein